MRRVTPQGGPLLERRRRETRHEIHKATLRLAREHGFDRVTIEMISNEAGISRRTFFNYFPGKEAAVVEQPPNELNPDLIARFVSGGPSHPRVILTDLTRMLVEQLAQDPPERQDTHDIFEIASATPAVFAALMARFDTARLVVDDAVARRMGPDTDEQIPHLIASVAIAAVRTGMERWSQDTVENSPVPHVEHAVSLLRTLLTNA